MNWVGGARSRVCKADFKSKKGQQRLQKEYFEKRRLGTINLNVVGKQAKKVNHQKETKCKISQDILDFQNLKHHIDGVTKPVTARAAFRVVNLNKKTALPKNINASCLNHEHVEMPLSPVGKHSTLNLSQSPTNQEESIGTSYGEQINGKPSTSYHMPSTSTLDKSDGRQQNSHQRIPNSLQFFGKFGHGNHLFPSKRETSNTIDLFGATIEKPQKCNKDKAMPPPLAYGVTSTKAKRKKPNIPYPRIGEGWHSSLSSDTDCPSDDHSNFHSSSTSRESYKHHSVCENTPFLDYPTAFAENSRTHTAGFHLVPSQTSHYSLKDLFSGRGMVNNKNDYLDDRPKLFEPCSPMVAPSLVSSRGKDVSLNYLNSKEMSSFLGNEPRLDHYTSTNISDAAACNPSDLHSDIHSHYSYDLGKGKSFRLNDAQFLRSTEKYVDADDDFSFNNFNYSEGDRARYHNHLDPVTSSDLFYHNSTPGCIKHGRSFKLSDDFSSCTCNIMSNFSSTFHVENSMDDGNILINETLTAEWFNITSGEEKSSIQGDKRTASTPVMKDNAEIKRPLSFFEDKNMKHFEPLQASTPCNIPICINKQELDLDVDKQSTRPLGSDKVYQVNDLLDEMMALETQAQKLESQPDKKSSKDEVARRHEADSLQVKEVVLSLVSRVEESLELYNKTKAVKDIASCSSTNQEKRSSETSLKDTSLFISSDYGDGTASKDTLLCQGRKQNHEEKWGEPNCQNIVQRKAPGNNFSDSLTLNSSFYSDELDHPLGQNNNVSKIIHSKDHEKNKTTKTGRLNSLYGSSNYIVTESKSLSQISATPRENSLNFTQHCNKKCNYSLPKTTLDESCPKIASEKHNTVSTQTVQKQFRDRATSPIMCFTSEPDQLQNHHSDDKSAVPKVYSLRSRSRLCENDATRREE